MNRAGVTVGSVAGATYSDGTAILRLTESLSDSVKSELNTGTPTWDLSGKIVGSSMLMTWTRRKSEGAANYLAILAGEQKGREVFLHEGALLTGFTYEGDYRVDPSTAPNLKEWRLKPQG